MVDTSREERALPVAEIATVLAIIALAVALPSAAENTFKLYERWRGRTPPPPPDEKDGGEPPACREPGCGRAATLVIEDNGLSYWQCVADPPHKLAVES